MYVHPKYPIYQSKLTVLLSWEEIEEQIINNYTDVKHININNNDNKDNIDIDDIVKRYINKYNKMSKNDLKETLKYLFTNYKEFLYFSIRDGKINGKFQIYNRISTNNWYKTLKTSDNSNFYDFFNKAKRELHGEKIKFEPPYKWYANNCIVRMENWSDSSGLSKSYVSDFLEMIEITTKTYNVPDCDIIINRKDFPFLTTDGSYSYYSLYDKNAKNDQPKNCWTVCSQSTRDNNLDIAVPSADEWNFLKNINKLNIIDKWEDKINIGVWRGSTTGCGVDINNNIRLKLADISYRWKKENLNLIDVGIVQFVKGFKVNDMKISYLNPKLIKFPKAQFLTFDQQSKYKYIFNLEGNVAAYRLGSLFYMNSVVINIESSHKMWFESLLKHKKHYIQIKNNFEEDKIKKVITKLRENDDAAKSAGICQEHVCRGPTFL